MYRTLQSAIKAQKVPVMPETSPIIPQCIWLVPFSLFLLIQFQSNCSYIEERVADPVGANFLVPKSVCTLRLWEERGRDIDIDKRRRSNEKENGQKASSNSSSNVFPITYVSNKCTSVVRL